MSTFTNLLFHVVYSTKYRRQTIHREWGQELFAYCGGILADQKGVLLRAGGVADHVHLLVKLSPTLAISDVLRVLKSNSSRWINDRSDVTIPVQWQSGFAAFSVSESQTPTVNRYIDNQEEHHRRTTYEKEFLAMLKRHRIEYDPRYVFEQEIIE